MIEIYKLLTEKQKTKFFNKQFFNVTNAPYNYLASEDTRKTG